MECIYCGSEEKDENATVCKQCGEPLMNEEELERQFSILATEVQKDHLDIEKQKQLQTAIRQLPKPEPAEATAKTEEKKE